MKKTLYINLSGFAFHIDEDAYDKLHQYLHKIERSFSDKEEAKEIVLDIEARIAELFHGKKESSEEVITLKEVEEVINTIGQPQDIVDEDESEREAPQQAFTDSNSPPYGKRLFRDPDGRVLGGVCGGLGAYFNIDPLVFRIAFLLLFFFYGSSLIVYLVLWIVMPKALTISQKLQMKGPAAYERWQENIKNEYKEVHNTFKRSNAYQRSSVAYSRSTDMVGNALGSLMRMLGAIIGIVLMITTLIVLVSLLFTFTFGFAFFDFSGVGNYVASLPGLFVSENEMLLGSVGLILVSCIPVMILFYLGFKLVFRFHTRFRYLGLTSLLLWIAGLIMLFYVSAKVARDFTVTQEINKKEMLVIPLDSIIYIKPNKTTHSLDYKEHLFDINQLDIYANNQKLYVQGNPRVELVRGQDYSIQIKKSAKGASVSQAQKNGHDIEFFWMQKEAVLNLDAIFTLQENSKIRNQKLQVVITVPQGVKVEVDDELEWLIHNGLN